MTDETLREVEKIATKSGAIDDKLRYANALERVSRNEEARLLYLDILQNQTPTNAYYEFAREGWVRSGGPWVEFNPPDYPKTARFYNVLHEGMRDDGRKPYNVEWAIEHFKPKEVRIRSKLSHEYLFTHETLSKILSKEKILARPPTASQVHSHIVMIETLSALQIQPENAQRARRFIRNCMEGGLFTGTQVDFDNTHLNSRSDYLRNLQDGAQIAHTIFNANISLQELDSLYNNFFGTSNGIYFWRPDPTARGKRTLILFGGPSINPVTHFDRFQIICDNDAYSVRLVTTKPTGGE